MKTISLRDISKRFGAVVALDRVSLVFRPGEIHAVLGENGAGKTTLMRVMAGLTRPDSGTIRVDDRAVSLRSPRDAARLRIGMVHQHQMLVPSLTVAENLLLALGSERSFLLKKEHAREMVRGVSASFGLGLDPDARVEELPVGVAQRVEILKVLANEVGVMILDEPTAVLSPGEIDALLVIMRRLAESGVSVVFVTHKLQEVRAAATRVTVLRRGRVSLEAQIGPRTQAADLARAVVGEEPPPLSSAKPVVSERIALSVRGVRRRADGAGARGSRAALSDVSFDVREGEILGIAGVDGNGQVELARIVAGIEAPDGGTLRSPDNVAFVPGDRTRQGIVSGMSLWENLALGLHREPGARRDGLWGRLGALNRAGLRRRAERSLREYAVHASGIDQRLGELSGGNQQKVVLARELSRTSSLLVAMNPTRGLDVGAARFVHETIRAYRNRGGGVLLISFELEEILSLCDRVAVLFRGALRVLPAGEKDPATIGALMVGTEAPPPSRR